MENQRFGVLSYFENKPIVKNKIKKKFEKIIKYEEYKERLMKRPRPYTKETIIFLEIIDEYIEKWKNKVKRDTFVYIY